MGKATIFSDSPLAQAEQFKSQGASWLHIVDLNGAFEGVPIHKSIIEEITKKVDINIQLGGGIRNIDTINHWLEAGVQRVILGTAALKDPELVHAACAQHPGKIAVGIDARGGKVATEGWAEISSIDVVTLAAKFENAGVAAIIYTNIDRDGALQGVDIQGTRQLARSTSIPVIASGGVSDIDDLKAVGQLKGDGVIGVISGRAIYENRFTLSEALTVCA